MARTEPPGPASAPAASSPPPKPPIMMLMTERFIASAMSLVRIAPDAPTRAPAMIRTGLSMTKPAIATAVPVNEFSSEMTTGMSAPPIGRVIVMPKIRRRGQDDQHQRDVRRAGHEQEQRDDER